MLTFPSDPHHVRPAPQTTGLASASSENRRPSSSVKSQLTRSEFKSQLTVVFFFQIPKFSVLPDMTSLTSPVYFPIWVFYWDISDCHIHPART